MNTRLRDQLKHDGVTTTISTNSAMAIAGIRTIPTGFYDNRQGLGLGPTQAGEHSTHVMPQGLSAGALALGVVLIGAGHTRGDDNLSSL